MEPLTPAQIAGSFVNCSKSQAKSIPLPSRLSDTAWDNHDFLGWRDGKAPLQSYLVSEFDGRIVGLVLRSTGAGDQRRGTGLCNICFSAHSAGGVGLFVARRAGAAGREGNTVGTYLCEDLACSLYARRLKELTLPQGETMPEPERVARLQRRLHGFLSTVLA